MIPATDSIRLTETPTASPLRREPRQKRSRERVAAILTSTAELLEESGYQSLTTASIAEHAGLSVSSLYQFFANVDAIIVELVREWTQQFDAVLAQVEVPTLDDFPASLDSIVDSYVRFFRETPGFRAVYFSSSLRGEARSLDKQSNARLANLLATSWASLLDDPPADLETADLETTDLHTAALVTVHIADSLLGLAFRVDPSGDDDTITEAKRAVRAYLTSRIPALWESGV
ncbi:TetR family transcriptional regulator [Gordonia jinhuaensis]|uniref:TetR family transcriptional regulator n=1 Tax=Gordonia jinhuaensis TaxID=1517702 RepID=A0A916TCR9_9ACTN|nr:TetR/AcrR family transcriptional regulator [Gordonia jinhuaensis]GGB38718.1 TetR family transcriptional regulator [Gordonia jinhuaensis]